MSGVAMLVWMFHAGRFPWTEGDWRAEWTFFSAWKESLRNGGLPYYLGSALQGTERYLANLETPMMPQVAGLAFLSINTFVLLHLASVYSIGFAGLIALRRELRLGLLPWIVFVLIFTLNGHIVSHLSSGHLMWIAYFLAPWMLVSMVRAARGDRSFRNAALCAVTFAAMILMGGWHVFVWSWLFVIFACASPARMIVAVQISVMTALLAAVRLAPALVTFGTGANTFISGYPSLASLFGALVGVPEPTARLDAWEIEAFVGWGGLLLLGVGVIPFRDSARRHLNVMLLPAVGLTALSLGQFYGHTLFRLPGLVSERVATRLIVLPVVWLTLSGAVRLDAWWRGRRRSYPLGIAVLLGVSSVIVPLVLRAQTWRPHVGPDPGSLPTEVLKAMPVEPSYFWAFWVGAAISIATIVATAVVLKSRERS